MRNPLLKSILTFILGFYLTTLAAQESTVSSGNNLSGSNGSVSYSIGQVSYISNTTSSATVSQGVQQPYEIFVLSSSDRIANFNIKVYPNPVNDILTLQYSNHANEKADFQILDMEGKLIQCKSITGIETLISFQDLTCGEYFVKVTNESKELKVFKIIKP